MPQERKPSCQYLNQVATTVSLRGLCHLGEVILMELQYKHRYVRVMGWIMVIIFLIPALMVPYGVVSTGGQLWVIIPGMLVFLFGGMVTGLPLLLRYPALKLTQDGVYARCMFRTRFVRWCDIQQAGILLMAERYQSKELVLLLPGGVQQEHSGVFFRLRNIGRTIYVPYDKQSVELVKERYGPLDFDLCDNGSDS